MDIGPVSGGPVGMGLTPGVGPVRAPANAGSAGETATTASVSLRDPAVLSALSEPDLARLVAILQPAQNPQNAALTSDLLQAAIQAAAAGELDRALQQITELTGLDPQRADAIRGESGLQAVRPQIDALLSKLANVAQMDAETRVGQATELVESGAVNVVPGWDADAGTLLAIASRFLETGGHGNFVRATQVAQTVIDASHWAPVEAPAVGSAAFETRKQKIGQPSPPGLLIPALRGSWNAFRKRMPERVGVLWRRAPLLVLLLSWLAIGIAGGLASLVQRGVWPDAWPSWLVDAGFSLWGLGFVALVLFGFYMRVRNVRL